MAVGMGLLLVAVGLTPWLGDAPAAIRMMSSMLGVAGLCFLLAGWSLVRTVRIDRRASAVRACGCGHDHDLAEMRVTHEATCPSGGACGTGAACASCTLRG